MLSSAQTPLRRAIDERTCRPSEMLADQITALPPTPLRAGYEAL
jgi:hypothetical protein